jgi:hypothetical protein
VELPCTPNPTKITRPIAGINVLRLMFIVDLYSFYDCCS